MTAALQDEIVRELKLRFPKQYFDMRQCRYSQTKACWEACVCLVVGTQRPEIVLNRFADLTWMLDWVRTLPLPTVPQKQPIGSVDVGQYCEDDPEPDWKIMCMSLQDIMDGKVRNVSDVLADIRAKSGRPSLPDATVSERNMAAIESMVRDVQRRCGPAMTPGWIKTELEKILTRVRQSIPAQPPVSDREDAEFLREGLVAIAGAVCTPEAGYTKDGGRDR